MAGNNFGSFIPTSNVWEITEIQQVDVQSDQFKELLVRLYQNINNIALSLNTKDSALYDVSEFVNGQVFFSNPALDSSTAVAPTQRQVFRKVINFGALPNTGTTSVAHNIPFNVGFTTTRIYGSASDVAGLNYLPLPYASSTLANNISLDVTGTNVTIVTGSNRSNFTVTYVILEYIKF